MQNDIDAVGKFGVPKRIGSSVLDELDERAGEKISELKPGNLYSDKNNDNSNQMDHELSKHFQNLHESQFNRMESLESHYINNPHFLPQTPKRHVENHHNDLLNSKKLKLPVHSSPPVHDITKRIRRLRLRNSLTGGNTNQPRTPTQTALKSTPLTRQRPMNPPSFLRPTVNSLNKNVDTRSSSVLRNKESRANNPIPRSTSSSSSSSSHHQQSQPQPVKHRERRQMPRSQSSQSVFERLHSQTTISRSYSMGNVSVKSGRPRERERDNHNTNKNNNNNAPNSSRTKMTRSKTSGSLASHLDRPAWK